MAAIEKLCGCELLEPVQINNIPKIKTSEADGCVVSVTVAFNGEPVTLSGTIKGYVVRSDRTTVSYNGTRSGNTASVTIPNAALLPGACFITLVNIDGITTTTLAAVSTVIV